MVLPSLQQHFGFSTLRHGQAEVIERILAGHSVAAIFPTGSGKSLCYQLPALHLPHLTLVISPLLALMRDQLDFLRSKGIAAAALDSTLDANQSRELMAQVERGELKILMISVERLKNERFRRFIARIPLSLLVVDEAHCISEWGHNFRPDYLKLPSYRQQLQIPQVLLLTATATPAVIADMQRKFAIAPENVVATGFYRANLDITVLPVPHVQRDQELLRLIAQDPRLPTIVYVTLQQTAERVATLLQQEGIRAQAYHAGMASEQREAIQQGFMSNRHDCIVATIAFGMGIDKANIRRVVHYDLPKSIENYSQEIGRAGRDGQPAYCTVLASREQVPVLENFVYGDTPDRQSIALVLEEIRNSPAEWEITLWRLSQSSNIRQLPLKTLLVYLELAGVIAPAYSYFAEFRFKFIQSSDEILNRFNGERRQFLQQVFAAAPRARSWCSLDLAELARLGAERSRAVTALDYLHQQGWIELESKQMTEVYHRLTLPDDLQPLIQQLHQQFLDKERSELQRIQQMLQFFESSACLSQQLAHYFADTQAPQRCGHCSSCRGAHVTLPEAASSSLLQSAPLASWLQQLAQTCSPHPLTPRLVARHLCGLVTPLSSQLKLPGLPSHGRLSQLPFAEVEARVSAMFSQAE
ncbi:MAG: RecQ family ATP-dependent DNA helicase [Aeromonadaceae bacterium]|nr:RecQ family ATP-dependent DNA helicase [Aeromonadaceae bacterium]MBP8065034.1 RecQ family ATP-dependent DNA helicase [Aeromonadaceae bacterium]MBP9569385.1 RecQ family ATP-dependent DNA helicase [Aeromonadaceae bacterium]